MSKAGQYWDGVGWQQLGLTTSDITLSNNVVATVFYSIKDKNGNLFITCFGGTGGYAKIIRIDKNGVKAVANLGDAYFSAPPPTSKTPIILSRDNTTLFCVDGGHGAVWTIPTDFETGITQSSYFQSNCQWYSANSSAAFYKDLYIWVASGSTVKIYDYTTKAELASSDFARDLNAISCSDNNILYVLNSDPANTNIDNYSYNGIMINKTAKLIMPRLDNGKQMIMDKYGDLIILTNSGTASTLLKYTTAGTLIDTKNLANPSYNLAIDKDGNYFYYTALKEYQIDANTTQGQPFTSVGYETRGTGNTGFGSNSTGYQPSVYA